MRHHAVGVVTRDDPPFIDPEGGLPALSPREIEIVRLACLGLTNKEIGRTLDISPHTVSTHLRHIFAKLGVTRRAALALSIQAAPIRPGSRGPWAE